MRIKGITLEHHGDIAITGIDVGYFALVNRDRPLGRFLKPSDQAQCRRFATSGGTEKRQKFTLRNIEINAPDGQCAIPELFNQLLDGNSHNSPI